jgi:hypothetical protein
MNGYKLLLVSAVGERDGMALELAAETGEQVAEVFEDDLTGERTVTFFTDQPVSLSVVEWLLAEAARRL